jgi:hypothetical protein
MRAFDVTIRQLTDVNQSRIFQSNVNKGTEIHYIQNCALEFHSRLEVLNLEYSPLENRLRQVFPRVTTRTGQGTANI